MTATSVPSVAASSSRTQHKGNPVEKLCTKSAGGISREEAELRWFASLLWRAFPEARSERELSELAAEVLTTSRRPIHWKTVRNWLRAEATPHFRYYIPVIAMAGAESIFEIIDAEDAA